MELRARITTVLDTDLSTLFRPLAEDAKRARATVTAEMRGMGTTVVSEAQQAANRQREVFNAVHQLNLQTLKNKSALEKNALSQQATTERQGLALVQKNAADKLRIEGNLAKQREQILAQSAREEGRQQSASLLAAQKHAQKLEQLEKAASLRAPSRGSGPMGLGRSLLGSSMSAVGGTVRAGVGMASEVARGAGINFDLGGMIGKNVDLQKRATDLSNAGFMAGQDGEAGQRQDPARIMEDIRTAAKGAALDTQSAAEGLGAFVSKTGDLATGRAILGDMGKLARATGTEFGDMVSAAGDVATQLDEMGDKTQRQEKLGAIMRTIAGQGKLGAVEIKDLAVQMAKLSAVAPQFSGSFENNMGEMGALVQMARAKGGASSAPQAATSLGSFVNSFSKQARSKEFAARGIQLDDGKTGKLRSAEDIIVDSLRATKGDRNGMGKLFMDAGARRMTRGFETVYNSTKGSGADKEAAVRAEFAKLKNASMGKGEVDDSFKASMETNEAKAQLFQNQLQGIVDSLAGKFLPALEKAGPGLLSMADGAAHLAGLFGSMDPGSMMATAVSASIAKAALGEAMKQAMTGNMTGALAGLIIANAMVTITTAKLISAQDEENNTQKGKDIELTMAYADKAIADKRQADQDVLAAEYDMERADPSLVGDVDQKQATLDQARARQDRAGRSVDASKEAIDQALATYDEARKYGSQEEIAAGGNTRAKVESWGGEILKGVGVEDVNGKDREGLQTSAAVANKLDAMISLQTGLNNAFTGGIAIKSLPPGATQIDPGKRTGPGE